MLVVHHLAGILFDVDALDADLLGTFLGLDLDRSLADDRMIELADLIALRQIRVEIVLAVEAGPGVDLRLQRHSGPHRLAYAFLVQHRQHARHGGVDEAHLRVGLGAELRRGAGEELGLGRDLRMHLEADHDLPVPGGALDPIAAHHHASGRAVKPARSSSARPALSTLCSSSGLPMT